jgi:hypothetical protein
MQEPNLIPDKDIFGLDQPPISTSTVPGAKNQSRTVLFAVVLAIVAVAIGVGLYYLKR